MSDSPAAVIVDSAGNEAAKAPGGAVPAATVQVGGTDGTNLRTLKTDAAGELQIDVLSSALPSGAATEATLAAIKAKTDNLDVALSTRAVTGLTDAQLRAAAVPVSAAALPLPSGAATEATLAAIKAKTDNLDVALSTRAVTGLTDTQLRASAVPVSAAALPLPSGAATAAKQPALGTAGTPSADVISVQGVSGGTAVPVSAAALPLPSGAATSALQGTGNTSLSNIDTKTPALGQAAMAASSPVVIASNQSAVPVSGTVSVSSLPNTTQAGITAKTSDFDTGAGTDTVPMQGIALPASGGAVVGGTTTNPLKVDPTGTTTQPVSDAGGSLTVDAASWPLPTGAATETTLAAINTKTPTQGQAVMASSSPVVIASNQTVIPVSDNAGSLTVDTPQLPAALSGGRLDVAVGAALPTGANTIGKVDQGAAAALAGAWPTKLTDGTNVMPTGDAVARSVFQQVSDGTTGPVAVKAASTAPVASDKALVVVLSPNQVAIPVTVGAGASATPGLIAGRVQYGASAGALTAIRATAYTEVLTNFTGSIKSSSASDTSAGVGARTVRITYYDQTGAGPFTETATLNGTSNVNLASTDKCFIESIEVVTVGSTGWNVGTITLFTGAGGTGTTIGTVAVGTIQSTQGDNRTLWAHHYVPTGKTASIYNINCGTTGNQIGTVFLRTSQPLVANTPEVLISDFITMPASGPLAARAVSNPIKVIGFRRITMYVISAGSNTHFVGSADYSEAAS